MPKRRIPTKNLELLNQLAQASQAIADEPNWPAIAPTQAEVAACVADFSDIMDQVNTAQARFRTLLAEQRALRARATGYSRRIDQVTDGLYGPGGAAKARFGHRPKKLDRSGVGTLDRVIILQIADGTEPASLLVDWEHVAHAAAYQIEWFTDGALTQLIGESAVTESKFTITGLESGQQYWVRVRAIGGTDGGPWSDPATRVANI